MTLPIILHVLLIAFLHGSQYIAVEGVFSAIVESGEEHCYNVIAPAGVQSTIHGNFDILDDDESPDPIGVVLYDSKMVSQNNVIMSPVTYLCPHIRWTILLRLHLISIQY